MAALAIFVLSNDVERNGKPPRHDLLKPNWTFATYAKHSE